MLRDYQENDLAEIRALYRENYRRVLLVQPTGSGKGFLAAFIVHSAASRNKKIQFWVNRRTLVHDMSERLERLGIDHGVIMASTSRRKPWLPVQVASIDTLRNREQPPPADLIIIDEAHFAVSDGWKQMMARYPDAKFLLMTATPIRLDGRGLMEIADVMVMGPSVQTLIDQGYLVPSVVYAPPAPDVSGVKTTGGDFNQKALAAACDKNKIIGDIVKTWLYRSADRKSVCFAVDKAHAEHIAEEFRAAGVTATTVTDVTPDDERSRIWQDFDHGGLRMVTSVGVISYGWDHPICSTVVLARPTDSLGLCLQQIGRGCRPAPGKTHLLVLDHAGNTMRHGMYEDEREWSLSGGCINKRKVDDAPSVTFCRACFLTFRPGPDRCPACGVAVLKHKRTVQVVEGNLEEVRREVKAKRVEEWRSTTGPPERLKMFLDWKRISKERGYSHRWPYVKYSIIFGESVPKEFAGMR